MTKNDRRKQAIKRDRQKKIITITVGVIIVLAIAVIYIFNEYRQRDNRVFSGDNQSITLRGDGTFSALLSHNKTITGTYKESTEGGVTTVTFIYDGVTAEGKIEKNILNIPDEWDDKHGHSTSFPLTNGR